MGSKPGILQGDLRTSIFTNLPVASLIARRIEPMLSLMAITLVLTILVLDVLQQDYICTARAKGLGQRSILFFMR
jgi:peptide/nickel transport system permease protein